MASAYIMPDCAVDLPQGVNADADSRANKTENDSKDVATNPTPEMDTDDSEPYPAVLLPASELEDSPLGFGNEDDEGPIKGMKPAKKESWLKRHFGHSHPKQKVYEVRMSKDEYEDYFARDPETGEYRQGVVEPPGGRKEWVMQRLEEQKTWNPLKNASNSSAGAPGSNVAFAPMNMSGVSGLG